MIDCGFGLVPLRFLLWKIKQLFLIFTLCPSVDSANTWPGNRANCLPDTEIGKPTYCKFRLEINRAIFDCSTFISHLCFNSHIFDLHSRTLLLLLHFYTEPLSYFRLETSYYHNFCSNIVFHSSCQGPHMILIIITYFFHFHAPPSRFSRLSRYLYIE